MDAYFSNDHDMKLWFRFKGLPIDSPIPEDAIIIHRDTDDADWPEDWESVNVIAGVTTLRGMLDDEIENWRNMHTGAITKDTLEVIGRLRRMLEKCIKHLDDTIAAGPIEETT